MQTLLNRVLAACSGPGRSLDKLARAVQAAHEELRTSSLILYYLNPIANKLQLVAMPGVPENIARFMRGLQSVDRSPLFAWNEEPFPLIVGDSVWLENQD